MARGFSDDSQSEDNRYDCDLVEIVADVVAETKSAWLLNDGDIEAWVPKSQVERHHNEFTMPEWLASAKGFI